MFWGLNVRSCSSKNLELGGEIPRVVLDSPETECWAVHVTMCYCYEIITGCLCVNFVNICMLDILT